MFKRTRAYWEAKLLQLEKLKMGLEKKYIGQIKTFLSQLKKKFIDLLIALLKRIKMDANFLFKMHQNLLKKGYNGLTNLKAIYTYIQDLVYDFLKQELSLSVEFLSKVFKDIHKTFSDILRDTKPDTKYKQYKESAIRKKVYRLWERQTKSKTGKVYKYGKIAFTSIFDGFGTDLVRSMTDIIIKDTKKGVKEEVSVTNIVNKFDEVSIKTESELRTQATFQMNQAIYEVYIDNDIEQYRYSAILDARTSVMCRELDGQIFKTKEAEVGINYPPMHLNCRSFTIPIIGG